MSKAKPFSISKQVVVEAFNQVKANRGAAGVDDESIEDFEKDLKNNLYKIWNRMSSGSYFPPPVRGEELNKEDGSKRPLGIPTVADRTAQAVGKIYLEPQVEPCFHPGPYGYRPGKSAIEAVGVARQRCWRYNWVLDLDIKSFFDSLDHKLMMLAVRKHTDCSCCCCKLSGGSKLRCRQRMAPSIVFERYADDIIVHCKSERQAQWIKGVIEKRLSACKLELHPEKTKIVYCKDANRIRV